MTVRPRRPLATSLALLLALAPACTKEAAAETEELSGAKAREAVRVVTETLVQREVVRKLETSTRVESESGVQVFPRASGVVTAVSVEEGDVVAAGAMLAQLDDRDARLRLDDARAQLVDAESSRPKLKLAVRETQARLDAARRTAEQARRDHERNLALSEGGGDRPALISSKDLEASQLAQDRSLERLHVVGLLGHGRVGERGRQLGEPLQRRVRGLSAPGRHRTAGDRVLVDAQAHRHAAARE